MALRGLSLTLAIAVQLFPASADHGRTGHSPSRIKEADVLQLAQQLRHSGQIERAVMELTSLTHRLAGRGGSVQLQASALRELGEIELDRRSPKKAATYLEQSLSYDPSPGVVHYELGLAYRELGDNRKASLELQAALQRGFRNSGALFHLINAQLDSFQFSDALESSDSLIAEAPKAPDLMLRLGLLLFHHLYYRAALKPLRLASESSPHAYEPRFYLALTHHLLGEDSEAVPLLKALAAANQDSELLTLLASSEAQLKDFAGADRILHDTIQKWGNSPHPYLNLALIAFDQDRLDQAEISLDKLRALNSPGPAKVFYTVNRNACRELDLEAAQAGGIEKSGSAAAADYSQLAHQMQSSYHYAAAVQFLRLALRHGVASPRLLYSAGLSCFNLDAQSPIAVSLMERAVAADANFAPGWYLLGKAYARQQQPDQAIPAFEKAILLKPKASYYISIGKAYLAQTPRPPEATGKALSSYGNALRLEPENALAHYELGRLYSQIERLENAKEHFTRAIGIEPDFYEAYYALGHLCMRSGDPREGRKYLALFEKKRQAARQQSVLDTGLTSEDRE